MVYIDIPYFAENDRVDKAQFQKELEFIDIGADVQDDVVRAVFTRKPDGISFENGDIEKVIQVIQVFWRFGIGYRLIEETI